MIQVFSLLEERKVKQSVAQENDSNSTPFEYSIEVGMMEIYNDEGTKLYVAILPLAQCASDVLTSFMS